MAFIGAKPASILFDPIMSLTCQLNLNKSRLAMRRQDYTPVGKEQCPDHQDGAENARRPQPQFLQQKTACNRCNDPGGCFERSGNAEYASYFLAINGFGYGALDDSVYHPASYRQVQYDHHQCP